MTLASDNPRRSLESNIASQQADVLNIVLDSLTKGVVVVGADYRVLAFNRHFEELSQLPLGTVEVGVDFRAILRTWAEVTGQDREMLNRAVLKLDEAAPFEFEFPQEIKGECRWYLLTHNPSAGRGFVRTLTDITVRKVAEEALRKSENDYRTLINNLAAGVVVHGADTTILVSNVMASSILGLTEDQLRGKAAIDPEWCFRLEDGSPMPLENYPVNRVIATGEAFHGQVIGMHRSDRAEPTWALCSGYPVKDAEGRVIQAVITFSDITELKQSKVKLRASEESLAITLHSIGDAVIATDVVGLITLMNPTAERLTGWSLPEAMGRPLTEVFQIISAQTRVPSGDPVQAVLAHGEVVGLANHTLLLARDGQEYQISDSAAPIRDATGQIVGVVLVFSDVTEKYRLEETLSQTADLLENASELAKVGGWELDLASMKLTWSPGTYRLHELDPLTPVDVANGIQFYAPEAQPVITAAVRAAIETGTPYNLELPLLTAKGRAFWARAQCNPVIENGKVIKLLGAFQDITERKQAELELNQSHSLLTNLANLVPGVVYQYRLHPDGRSAFPYSSPGMNDIYEVTPEEVRLDAIPVFGRLHPDDFDAVAGAIKHSALTLEEFYAEFRVILPRQGLRWRWSQAHPQRLEDGSTLWHGIILDITERKQAEAALRESEERWKFALEGAGDGLWDWNVQTGAAYFSPRYKEMLGYADSDFGTTSDEWRKRIHPDDALGVIAALQPYLEGKPGSATVVFRMLCKDGSWRWIQGRGLVVGRDTNGKPTRMIGTNTDITERKLAEVEKHRLQAQLQQSQKMESLGTLAGGVAHDMNNVLGAILGLASAHIGTQPYGSPLHQALDTICKATERGGKMVKSLLSFARQSPAENNKLDMNAVLREQVALLERTTLAKVRLNIDLEANLRPILGDASALTNAFMNLCVNAVDAMPENGTLTLHTRNVDNDWIQVVVEDNGTGMPKEVLEKAMEPFFTTKETGKGTGLGLSMVFSTVKAHRGQMAIESEPGKGTRVMMRFPACEQETPIQASISAVTDTALVPRGTMKVLLIDDDDLIQSSVQAILEVLGHTAVDTAQSGEEALAMLEAGLEVDLVILDMNMPGLGGIGTLPRLRGLRPQVAVLLATGRVDQTAMTAASAFPGVTLLSKPFGLRELQKHLENIGLG